MHGFLDEGTGVRDLHEALVGLVFVQVVNDNDEVLCVWDEAKRFGCYGSCGIVWWDQVL